MKLLGKGACGCPGALFSALSRHNLLMRPDIPRSLT